MIINNNQSLVNYYAPWCGWCKQLGPVFDFTAGEIQHNAEYAERVQLGKVDCTLEPALCKAAHVTAYPSILIYVAGETHTRYLYAGGRNVPALVVFVDMFYRRFYGNQQDDVDASVIAQGEEWKADMTEGCRLVGSLHVNRVPGQIAIRAASSGHSFAMEAINVSHVVHSLHFGHVVRRSAPLMEKPFWTENVNVTIEHYLKVVGFDSPHQRKVLGLEKTLRTYGYSVSSSTYNATGVMPSALFTYDISPLVIAQTQVRMPWYRFFVHFCAIVGGTVTILRVLSSSLFAVNDMLFKDRIGKLN